jgi:hypothetical protein
VITGGKILSVEAKKLKEGTVSGMNVNIGIEDVKAEKNGLAFKYAYSVEYAPGVAEFKIVGEIYSDDKNAKAVEEKWRKSKTLEPGVAEELLTAITYSGTAVGTLLAFSVGISAPINVPRARIAPATPPAPAQ